MAADWRTLLRRGTHEHARTHRRFTEDFATNQRSVAIVIRARGLRCDVFVFVFALTRQNFIAAREQMLSLLLLLRLHQTQPELNKWPLSSSMLTSGELSFPSAYLAMLVFLKPYLPI